MADILIIGAGPAGLAAAAVTAAAGHRVTVLEREDEPGGIPRFCGHSPFGMREFGRLMGGRTYARRLSNAARSAGASILMRHSALGLGPDGGLEVATPDGPCRFGFDRMILATGTREATAAARLLPGARPYGVMNTGALQRLADAGLVPFCRPVILGSELVALSAILTCRALGIRPVALVEEDTRLRVRPPFSAFPRLIGLLVLRGATVDNIRGLRQVEGVELRLADGGTRSIDCDGVIVSGRFTPESALARMLGLALDPLTGGPQVDGEGRSSDPRIFAAGNMLRPVETAGWCWQEGRATAQSVLADLMAQSRPPDIPVRAGENIRWVMPQRISPGQGGTLQLRAGGHGRGVLELWQGDTLLHRKRLRHGPETRILVPLAGIGVQDRDPLRISLKRP
ncbi:FAD-dependent oxidoreductase [Halodurantibacterium flavum]|uniref:FAD-dependent oxidoreductase n=1 Tax=Halodurantibacterium flavum TaxID=1382802 RepID=A0ABW4S5Z0_9RHOB